jgi:hypothetical protein
VNPDCTGTPNVNVYNQSGTFLGTSVRAFVIVDNDREVGGIFTSPTLANGTNAPTVATFNTKRQFPRGGAVSRKTRTEIGVRRRIPKRRIAGNLKGGPPARWRLS